MEYLRQTVDSKKLSGIFDLPLSLQNKKVDVIILPIEDNNKTTQKSGSAFGRLNKYANPQLIPLEKGAWEQATVKKYANR